MISKEKAFQVAEWTLKKAKEYCPQCKDTCCNGTKHVIYINENELEPFVEKGMPIYPIDNFWLTDLRSWMIDLHTPLLTKERKEIPKPSLIETRLHMDHYERKNFTLNVDKYCPFYEQKSGCAIHEDERRPLVCKEYPVFNAREDNTFVIAPSCRLFNQQKVREDFRRTFPEPDSRLIIVKKRGEAIRSAEGGLNRLEYGRDVPEKEED